MSKRLLGAIAVLELATQANATPIAQCVLKSYAEVKAVPSTSGRVVLSVSDELRVDLLEEFGSQWAWVDSTDSDNRVQGWVSSLVLEILLGTVPAPEVKPGCSGAAKSRLERHGKNF